MKHVANPRRGRNRGNGKRHPALRSQTFESNGPDGKIRGTAQQVLDRYLALGRDAFSAGDPVAAESYFQHAEHYYRLLHSADGEFENRTQDRGRGATPFDPLPQDSPIEPGEAGEEDMTRFSL